MCVGAGEGGGGVEEGEFPLPQALIFYFSGISARSPYFIQVYFLSVLLFYKYFFLFTLAFDLFVAFVVVVVIVSFLAFCCQFRVFLLISVQEQRVGGGGEE